MKHYGIDQYLTLQKNYVMDKIDFILKLANSHSNPNSADLVICKAMVDTLSEKDTEKIRSCHSKVAAYICWRCNPTPAKPVVHYKSWQTYFNDLKLRKRGVYSNSRRILCRMLPYIGWNGQLKVLQFLINSSIRTEQGWAAYFLGTHWNIVADLPDKQKYKWYDLIINTWQQNHNVESAKLIVRHFPMQYVKQYVDEITAQDDYFHVALRLAELPAYNVKRELLTDNEYLYIMAKTNRDVPDELCQQALAKLLLSKAELTAFEKSFFWEYREKYFFSFLSLDDVRKFIWCFGKLGKTNLLINFYRFDKMAQKYLSHRFESSGEWEFRELIEHELRHLLRFYFPIIQLKKGFLEKMTKNNPAIGQLVRELQLHIE